MEEAFVEQEIDDEEEPEIEDEENTDDEGAQELDEELETEIASIMTTGYNTKYFDQRPFINIGVGPAVDYNKADSNNVKIRFIVGVRENNRPPGAGSGEVDRFKRTWIELRQFAGHHNWRHLISNEYVGIFKRKLTRKEQRMMKGMREPDGPMIFELDGLKWTSVTHYLIAQYYRSDPEYMKLFSYVEVAEDAVQSLDRGFAGSVQDAVREHQTNILDDARQGDPNYFQYYENLAMYAMLAKFTQNPIAKRALLLTDDAILAVRGGSYGFLEMPIYDRIKATLKAYPKLLFKGPNNVEQIKEEIIVISSSEELNRTKEIYRIGTGIDPETIIETDPIEMNECIVYIVTGGFILNLATITERFGDLTPVRRHVYAVERMADDKNRNLFIGVQRTPTNIIRDYLTFDVEIGDAVARKDTGTLINVRGYLEFLNGNQGVSIFLIAAIKSQSVVDLLFSIVDGTPKF